MSAHDTVKYPPLTPIAEAMAHLLAAVEPIVGSESLHLNEALGRVLAVSEFSRINVPPADNSAMDGYAVRCTDVAQQGETRLHISQRICAGATGTALQQGTAARIFTGAPIPAGADAVIMQEQCQQQDDVVLLLQPVKLGQNIRRAGEDIAQGDEILHAGCRLRAQELGLAASVGIGSLDVYRRVRVATFTTGDELLDPSADVPLSAGKIYDSNRYCLIGLLQTLGCEIVDLGRVEDSLVATQTALSQAATQADLVLTTGGVSVGEEDHIRNALIQLGQLNLWQIAIKPGKPLAFGQIDNTPFVGLAGNPVSAFVTFCLFVAPMLRKMQGLTDVQPKAYRLPADFVWPKAGKRQEYLRAGLHEVDGEIKLTVYPHQGSGVLRSVSCSDGLVEIPVNTTVKPNDVVKFYPYSALLA